MTRGIRNNNPLNIRRNPANQWQGLRPVQADKSFCQFKAMKWGLRAAIKLLDNYIRRGAQTPRQIISRWAPPTENDTASYVRKACQRAGLDPDEPVISWKSLRSLVQAMCWIESQYAPPVGILEEAHRLAERPSPNPGPELSSQSLTPNLRLPCGRQSLRFYRAIAL